MLKAAAELLLARGGLARLAARRRRGSTLILAYHNIVPDGAPAVGDRSLHLPLTAFRSQLDVLERTHEIVDLGAVRNPGTARFRPRAVITFDDAYRGALSLALPELARRGLPATIFVAPGLLGSTGCWWDLLAPEDGSGLAPSVRNHVLDALHGDGAAAVSWALANSLHLASLPVHMGIATEEELRAAAGLPGIRIGAHSWSHANLARLDDSAFDRELTQPLSWLRLRFNGTVLPWLAYPYGLAASNTHVAARSAGYEGVLKIDGGWVESSATDFVLPRLNIPAGLSTDGFVLRASGVI